MLPILFPMLHTYTLLTILLPIPCNFAALYYAAYSASYFPIYSADYYETISATY